MEVLAFARASRRPEPETMRLEPPAMVRLGEIQVPTLVLVGDLDYPQKMAVATTMSQEIAEAQSGSDSRVRRTFRTWKQPEEFNRLVLDFIDGIGKPQQ